MWALLRNTREGQVMRSGHGEARHTRQDQSGAMTARRDRRRCRMDIGFPKTPLAAFTGIRTGIG